MRLGAFNFLSIHNYCRSVPTLGEAVANPNSVFRPDCGPPAVPCAPEFVDAADRHMLASFTSPERNRAEYGVGFDGSEDYFLARLDNVTIERKTFKDTECFRIFVDAGVALSEPGNAHYKAAWPALRGPDTVFVELGGATIPLYLHPIVEPEVSIDEPVLFMLDRASRARNYYHWMCQVLPRLWPCEAVPELGKALLLVNDIQLTGFRHETLYSLLPAARLAGFPWQAAQFRRLYLPSFLSAGEFAPRMRDWVRYLRQRLGPPVPASRRRRLYVSRRHETRRRILNEDAILRALEPLGFECLSLQGLTVANQIDVFAAAEAVVLPHGAACVNLAAAAPGTLVIECQPSSLPNPTVWQVAAALDHRYGLVISDEPPGALDYEANMTIDPAKLLRVVNAGLAVISA